MDKAELIEQVVYDVRVSRAQAERALNTILIGIADTIRREGEVYLPGFGIFRAVRVEKELVIEFHPEFVESA